MENIILSEKTAQDIDSRVAKILRDLGSPEPPLRLEVVRELLNLDREYYSVADGGTLRETVHRLKLAGKQVIKRPALLWDVVKKLELKALWIPDRKRILLDVNVPSAKQRWVETHEIGHGIIPWHGMVMHGDSARTLSRDCQEQLEAEANYAAGRLLFFQDDFVERLSGAPLSFNSVQKLGKEFGNTLTSTLWQAVESQSRPTFGLVSRHPKHAPVEGKEDIRYFIRSRLFAKMFAHLSGNSVFSKLSSFCFGNRGPIGQSSLVFSDINRNQHVFNVETFYNSHDALTLGVYCGVQNHQLAVSKLSLSNSA